MSPVAVDIVPCVAVTVEGPERCREGDEIDGHQRGPTSRPSHHAEGTFSARAAALLSGKLARRLEGTGAGLEPYHDRVRESVTEYLSSDAQRAAHRDLAEALSLSVAGESRPELLLRHLRACGELDRAYELAKAAAQRAEQVLAFDRAAGLFSEALELAAADDDDGRRKLRIALGTALGNAGRGAVAAEVLTAAAVNADIETRSPTAWNSPSSGCWPRRRRRGHPPPRRRWLNCNGWRPM